MCAFMQRELDFMPFWLAIRHGRVRNPSLDPDISVSEQLTCQRSLAVAGACPYAFL